LQLRLRHIARSVVSNWLATGATLAAGFFLAPFVVHRLGNVAYGVWVLAISSVNYLMLLDLGMRSSVLRFVSKGHTQQDHEGASEVISAALWVRLQISGLVLVLSGALAAAFPHIFKVPPDLALDAREAILIIGVTTAVTMSLGVLGGVLSALNRYDLQSYATLVQLAIRVIGVVAVLLAGHGIVAIAFCELLAAVVGNILLALMARRVYPELQIRLKKPNMDVLRQIWTYSVYAFMITVAVQLVYQTDNLVVGAFVSASAVTFYSIGNSLCRYSDQIVGSMTMTFVPAASTYEAAGDISSLRSLYYNGTRATLAISLPILVTLLIRGHSFIGVWMGAQYAKSSGTVLAILAVALLFSFSSHTAGAIAYGVEKHKTVAKWAMGEAISNLTLSMVLAHFYGIYGVAVGTLVPSLFVHVVLWPRYVSELVGVTCFEVYWKVWAPMFLIALPFAIASYAVDVYFPVHSKTIFFLQTLALLPIFLISAGVVFKDAVRQHVLPRVRTLYAAAK
jgi:Membrane protein involved in the export of O-antigen and teichoic acid